MKIHFCGAAQTVTGSQHLINLDGYQLLLDCGLIQGKRKEAFALNREFLFDPQVVQAVVLSHAHIDHSGNLPSLFRAGFRGPVFCTEATRDLCELMLRDAAHIQESDVRHTNKWRRRKGKQEFEPLYTAEDAEGVLRLFKGMPYDLPFDIRHGITCHFRDAGHILGSAIVVLDTTAGGQRKRLVFSGDLGRTNRPILRDPATVEDAQIVIMESTYGNRTHDADTCGPQALNKIIKKTIARGGRVIIPAFSVGRTQEVVYYLNELWDSGQLPRVPVYIDSPLSINATEVFRAHPECFDADATSVAANSGDNDPLGFRGLEIVREAEKSKALNATNHPCIIISASGMCESGRILHHLRHSLANPKNTLLFVGYQGLHTLGRQILEGRNPIKIHGEPVEVNAEISRLEGFSAHADQDEITKWFSSVAASGKVETLFLVHGEIEPQTELAKNLKKLGSFSIKIPERDSVYEV